MTRSNQDLFSTPVASRLSVLLTLGCLMLAGTSGVDLVRAEKSSVDVTDTDKRSVLYETATVLARPLSSATASVTVEERSLMSWVTSVRATSPPRRRLACATGSRKARASTWV